jgi:hypothetical protein
MPCEGDVGGASIVDGGVSDFMNVFYERYFDLLRIHICRFATNTELICSDICVCLLQMLQLCFSLLVVLLLMFVSMLYTYKYLLHVMRGKVCCEDRNGMVVTSAHMALGRPIPTSLQLDDA